MAGKKSVSQSATVKDAVVETVEEVVEAAEVNPRDKSTDGKQCVLCACYVGDRRCAAYAVIPMDIFNGEVTHDTIQTSQFGEAVFTPAK